MKARKITCGVLGVLLLAAIAAIVILVNQRRGGSGQASDPSYVLITAPSNGDIIFVGDPVYVQASAMLLHRNLGAASLFVDGGKYSLDAESQLYSNQQPINCPSTDTNFCGEVDTRQLWIPTQAGQHNLYICIDGDNTSGAAWNICSDPVNVTVADPAAQNEPAGVYSAADGDTIASVAQKFDLPPLMVAAANPQIDPSASLPKDTPINIPRDPSLIELNPQSVSAPRLLDSARMTFDAVIDKAYCYYSFDGSNWGRIPAAAQTFVYALNGQLDLTAQFRAITIPASGATLALECWGWNGQSLVALGRGQTNLGDANDVHLQGEHFSLVGILKSSPPHTMGGTPPPTPKPTPAPKILPPHDLTITGTLDICINHFPDGFLRGFIGPLFCKAAIEKYDRILVWEWGTSFPPAGYSIKIDGYKIYRLNSSGKPVLMKTIADPEQKVFIDIGWHTRVVIGPETYCATAYLGALESAPDCYKVSGEPIGLAKVTILPSTELYGGEQKHKQSTPPLSDACAVGFPAIVGSSSAAGSEIAVGFEHFEPEGSCLQYYWEYSRAQVVFDLSAVKGPVSSATLSYRQDFTTYPGRSCARELGTVTTTKSGVDMKDLARDPYQLLPYAGYTGAVFKVDVTSAVRDWMLGTPNYGFLFVGADETLPDEDYEGFTSQSCWTAYSKVVLTVTYFVP